MSTAGVRRRDTRGRHEASATAGRRATLSIPHHMLPPHVDKLGLVVNRRLKNGKLQGYDGQCKADGSLMQRTFIVIEEVVKDKDGNALRTDTRTHSVPLAMRDPEVGE